MKNNKNLSLLSLLLINSYPIVGVLFLGWNLSSILFFYWFENVVIGFFNVLKMRKSAVQNKNGITVTVNGHTSVDSSNSGIVLFFILHYGLFTFVHGTFLFALFIKNLEVNASLLLGIISLFISHGISYYTNYIGKEEYKNTSSESLMIAPYGRVIIMQFTVILGSMLIVNFNEQNLGPLIVLVVMKTVVDMFSHNYEHNKYVPDSIVYGKPINKTSWLAKKLLPGYEQALSDTYKQSVETGRWDQIRSQIDPEVAKRIEDYWYKNFGIGKGSESSNSAIKM